MLSGSPPNAAMFSACPLQRRDLVEEAVIAGGVVFALGAEFGMREEAEHAEAIVDGDDHRAARGEFGAAVVTFASLPEPAQNSPP